MSSSHAVYVGVGVALLASMSMTKSSRQLWRTSARSFVGSSSSSSTLATSCFRTRTASFSSTSNNPTVAAAAMAKDASPKYTYKNLVQLLHCYQQLDATERSRLTNQTITVVQFNILASNLATRNHFPYVVDSSLTWENRKMTLLRQLEALDADIVCLEELSDYWTFFKPELSHRGYDSVYVKRPSLHVSNWSGEKKQDGCGIFYKKAKFELKECESINFHDSHDRVALLALLKMRELSQYVLVGCTHLWWNPKKVDHQMAELFELEEEMIRMSSDVKDKYERELYSTLTGPKGLPIILCGDFNNSPESSIYDYMQHSFMRNPNIEDINEAFRSAYACYQQNLLRNHRQNQLIQKVDGKLNEEPPHTTVNFRRCWTIDYIWYSSSCLVPRRVLEIPSEEILRSEDGPEDWFTHLAMTDMLNRHGRLPTGKAGNHNGIPNSQFGSDHVPLLAEFEYLLQKT